MGTKPNAAVGRELRSAGANASTEVLRLRLGEESALLRFMSRVGNCKFNYFATQMTTHEAARMLDVTRNVTLM